MGAKLEVLHVYGQIGPLFAPGERADTSFGQTQQVDYVGLSEGIKTFTEAVDSEMSDRIKERIRGADTLVFLGFGWLPQNLELLRVADSAVQRIFFTTQGIQEADRETVILDLQGMVGRGSGPTRSISNSMFREFQERGGCADLFRDHRRQLTRR